MKITYGNICLVASRAAQNTYDVDAFATDAVQNLTHIGWVPRAMTLVNLLSRLDDLFAEAEALRLSE